LLAPTPPPAPNLLLVLAYGGKRKKIEARKIRCGFRAKFAYVYREYFRTFCGGTRPAFNLGSGIGAPGTTGKGNTPAQIGSA